MVKAEAMALKAVVEGIPEMQRSGSYWRRTCVALDVTALWRSPGGCEWRKCGKSTKQQG